MTEAEIVELTKRHTISPWSAQGAVDPIAIDHAEGVYLYTPEGRRILDFNSQLMSVNIGHGDRRVLDAMDAQARKLQYVSPAFTTEIRARVAQKLARIFPGDIDTPLLDKRQVGHAAGLRVAEQAHLLRGARRLLGALQRDADGIRHGEHLVRAEAHGAVAGDATQLAVDLIQRDAGAQRERDHAAHRLGVCHGRTACLAEVDEDLERLPLLVFGDVCKEHAERGFLLDAGGAERRVGTRGDVYGFSIDV